MKIAYIARSIIPSQAANSVHVMKICESFAELCGEVDLVVPKVKNSTIQDDVFDFYGIRTPFSIRRIKKPEWLKGFYSYYFAAAATGQIIRNRYAKVITRDPLVAFMCVLLHKKVVLDLHGELAQICGRAYRIIKWDFFRKSKYLKLVMITDSLVRYYQKKYGVDPTLTTVLPDGCTLENFEAYKDQPLFTQNAMRMAYAGSFGVGRGYEIIEELAKNDKTNIYTIYGGKAEDACKVTGHMPPENIDFRGFIANRDIPQALCAQDILLLPYQDRVLAKGEDTGKVMSPLKLFESMASGRVIIASELDVLKEILNESNCYFAVADDAISWKKVVEHISEHREEAKKKAERAMQDVKRYTWKIRAQRMLDLIGGVE